MSLLVIKLGALGDMVQATTAFKSLRAAYPSRKLALLTTAPYVDFAKRLGIFDQILVDSRLKITRFREGFSFLRNLSAFKTIIDLQGVDRTWLYSKLTSSCWCRPTKEELICHPQERFARQFKRMGIPFLQELDLTALAESFPEMPPQPYVLIIPGASQAHDGQKRWPEIFYDLVCISLKNKGITPVLIGQEHFSHLKNAVDLTFKTSFYQIISLAQKAVFTLGNDTGPMLLAASAKGPTYTFYSRFNPPSKGGPCGPRHTAFYADDLSSLQPEVVLGMLLKHLP